MSFIQEYRAGREAEKLSEMVPVDLRIISCKDLFINQSSLTGESFPIEKTSEPGTVIITAYLFTVQ